MEPKASARYAALTRWAEAAAGAGHDVPAGHILEVLALTRSLETPEAEHPAVMPWDDTIRWIMAKASMGVLDPYSQLPPELAVPRATSSAHAQDDDAAGAAAGPEPPVESAIGTAAILTDGLPSDEVPVPSTSDDEGLADDAPGRMAGTPDQPRSKAPAVRPRLKVPRWEEAAREQTVAAVRKFADPLKALLERDANEGIEWMVLTNGQIWQVYHLTGGLPVVVDRAFDVDLLGPEPAESKASKLFYLHHESLKRRQIEEVWRHSAATAPELLLDVILSEPVLDLVRREVKKRTGTATSTAVLRKVIRTEVAEPKLLDRIPP